MSSAPPPASLPAAAHAPFAHRDFRLYMGARFLGSVANLMLSVAVGWEVYERTHDPFALGLVGLFQFLPAIILSLATGQVADRFDRRGVVGVCFAALGLVSLLLYVQNRYATNAVWPIYSVMALFAVGRAFAQPAGQALVPDLVPAPLFSRAVAWGSSVFEAASISGPALGGWIYGLGGARSVYLAGAALYFLAMILVASMRIRTGRMEKRAVSLETVLAGVVYVWRNKVILGSVTLDLFAVLFGGAVALLPVYAHDVLDVGPIGLGILRSAPSVGAGVVAIVIAFFPLKKRVGATMLACVALFGAATVVFGLSRNMLLSLAALAVVGAADMVSVVVRQTLVQIATPGEMRGRVSAVNMVFIGASNELGELESGMTASWFGTVPAVVFGGVAAIVVVAIYALKFPELRKADSLELRASEQAATA
jgi:MFS family permease